MTAQRPISLTCVVTVLTACLLVQTSAGGFDGPGPSPKGWERTTLFDGKGYAWLHSAHRVSDGYVVVGIDDHKGLVIKLDEDGVKQWARRFSYTAHDELYCAKETKDGGYILAGAASGESENEGLLVKTSSDGREEWHRLFRGKCNRLYGVDETQRGYVLAGSTTGNQLGYLVKTDAKGGMVADAAFGTDGSVNTFNSVRRVKGGFLVTGITRAGDGSETRGWVLVLDHTLREKRERVYKDDGPLFLSSSLPVPTGGYLLAGMVYSSGYKARLMKVSKSLDEQWEITLEGGNNELYPSLFRDEMGRCNVLSGNGRVGNTWICRICNTGHVAPRP